MWNTLKKQLIRNLISGLIVTALYPLAMIGLPAQAMTVIEVNQIKITNNSVTSDTISYCLNTPAKVTLGIYQAEGQTSKKVAILTDNEVKYTGCYTAVWDGKYGFMNEVGTKGNTVSEGEYFYYISAQNQLGSATASGWITVGNDDSSKGLKIVDVELENAVFDPWDDQKAKITFTINKDAYITLEISDDDDEKVVTLVDNKWYGKGEYTIYWNGENQFGDTVSQDEYTFKLKAKTDSDTDNESGTLQVKKGYINDDDQTEDPRIKDYYVSKETFDPGRKEKEYIVFTLTAKADVQITIYDKNDKKIVKLLDESDKQPGTYVVEWDGSEVLDQKATFTYKIFTRNNKGEDIKSGKIKVAEDDEDKKTSNLYKDTVDTILYNPKFAKLGISFKLEKDAEVTIEIRDSKHLISTVVKDQELPEGAHTIYWDGLDKYGEVAEDGLYEYRIIAANNKGKETEEGNFSIENATKAKYKTDLCAQFTDVATDNQYCEAIEWAVGEDIFQGYNDGSFRSYQPISRSEALKVILKALNVKILSSNGETLGFSDTGKYEWYAPYIKTALTLGIVHGYQDGSFKPNQTVTKAEGLIMVLKTGTAQDGLIIPTNNIGQPYYDTPNTPENKWYLSYAWFAKAYSLTDNATYFYPAEKMTRGEMADMLYRYHKNNFDEN